MYFKVNLEAVTSVQRPVHIHPCQLISYRYNDTKQPTEIAQNNYYSWMIVCASHGWKLALNLILSIYVSYMLNCL